MINTLEESDIAAISTTAMNYAQGWYDGDATRMERALHSSLVKRTIMRDNGDGWTVNRTATCDAMILWTREAYTLAICCHVTRLEADNAPGQRP